ncbi:MAG: polysaccharide export protein [Acidobacteria bacterium]|nr:polysaccharide export protein [Acidobacteriota bacterium]MCI0627711.1 polysaccharide export protein [Acidobacteriota bacterium]MCI0722436.1 polysaccharide export protein [Acidobacteriota bacterium]
MRPIFRLYFVCLAGLIPGLMDSELTLALPEQTVSALSSYLLGPDDQLTIRALDAEEISDKPVRIGSDGTINLPLVGRLKVAGLTVEQLEGELKKRLQTYIQNPQVTVSVVEYRSQTVSVIGSVKNPGAHQVRGRKRLIEVLSLAGGLLEDAGHSLKITRRREWGPIPLPGATLDPTGQFNIAEVNLKALIEARTPEQNIPILPNDVISVPRAEMVYVIGDVRRSGGFVLKNRDSISVLEALSLAEGLDRTASPKKARILRPTPGSAKRTEIPVNLKQMLAGEANDVTLNPDDILFVPGSKTKGAVLQTLQTAASVVVGVAVWR